MQIESLPYQEVIAKTDRKSTFFYLDPPYWDKNYYHFNLTEADFIEMERLLREIKGKFLLSINDVPAVRELFKYFKMKTVNITYTAPPKTRIPRKELLISNY